MAKTKICGLKDATGLAAALEAGAWAIGLVFFPKSPRHVSLETAAGLANMARGRAEIVAVTVDADDALVSALRQRVRPDWLQLHGAESPARAASLRPFATNGVIKALPIARRADFAPMAAFAEAADLLLFDAKAPQGAALPGGNGAAFDWALMRAVRPPAPWILSGGLTTDTVAQAIAESGATHVDVSSGVESGPGVKDASKVSAFVARAGAA